MRAQHLTPVLSLARAVLLWAVAIGAGVNAEASSRVAHSPQSENPEPPRHTPTKQFFNARLLVRIGVDDLGITVGDFVDRLTHAEWADGTTATVVRWDINGSSASLVLQQAKQPLQLRFCTDVHTPSTVLLCEIYGFDGDPDPMQFASLVMNMPEASVSKSSDSGSRQGEPIVGAFGYRLGDVFEPDSQAQEVTSLSPKDIDTYDHGLFLVELATEKRTELFEKYFVLRTSKDHRIVRIIGETPRPQCGSENIDALARVLLNKYLPREADRFKTLSSGERITIPHGRRLVALQCSDDTGLFIIYGDVDLGTQYHAEEKAAKEDAEHERHREAVDRVKSENY